MPWPQSLRLQHRWLALVTAIGCFAAGAPGQGQSASAPQTEQQFLQAMVRYEATLAASPADKAARKGETAAAIALAAEKNRQRHPEDAMEILERAIAHLPDEPTLLLNFGLGALALGQVPIADQALHTAAKLHPGDPEITYALARLELEQQHMPDAERDLKLYLTAKPNDASAFFGLGKIYAAEQRNEDARAAFETSLKLQPVQTESVYELGALDLNMQQDDAAAAFFTKVLQRDPNHAGALTGMGQLALRAKHYAEAEALLARAEKSDPGYAPPHYYRGLALAKLGRTEEAQSELHSGDSRPHATAPTAPPSP